MNLQAREMKLDDLGIDKIQFRVQTTKMAPANSSTDRTSPSSSRGSWLDEVGNSPGPLAASTLSVPFEITGNEYSRFESRSQSFPAYSGNEVGAQRRFSISAVSDPTNVPGFKDMAHSTKGTLFAVVQFKLFRSEVYQYNPSLEPSLAEGCLVIVEADRGEDLGFVVLLTRSMQDAISTRRDSNRKHLHTLMKDSATAREMVQAGRIPASPLPGSDSIFDELNLFISHENYCTSPRRVLRVANDYERRNLYAKEGYEAKARRICSQKAQEFGFRMEVLEAEAQIDGNKLTFYYYAEDYITFNPLVQDLFKEFKTRIWLSAVNPASCFPQASYQATTHGAHSRAPQTPMWNAPPSAFNNNSGFNQHSPQFASLTTVNPPPWNTNQTSRRGAAGQHGMPRQPPSAIGSWPATIHQQSQRRGRPPSFHTQQTCPPWMAGTSAENSQTMFLTSPSHQPPASLSQLRASSIEESPYGGRFGRNSFGPIPSSIKEDHSATRDQDWNAFVGSISRLSVQEYDKSL